MGEIKILYKVLKTDFNHLEEVLNSIDKDYEEWDLYQILPEHCYDGAFAIIVLQQVVEVYDNAE